jgi:competence protein ComEC
LEGISSLSWSSAWVSARPTWVWAAAFSGAVLLLAPRGLPGRWLGLLLMLPLTTAGPTVPDHAEAQFTLLDVGQGLAAVVRTRGHVLVYDTGPGFPSGFNTGEAVVLPFLRRQGMARIDTLVLSHGDRDHAGGYAGLRGRIAVDRILSGEPAEVPGGEASPCLAGDGWRWDGVAFQFVYPEAGGLEGNASSCVLRVSTDGASVLLTGDVDSGVEDKLVARRPDWLPSTLLVAAHHGSDTSTSAAFLDAVSPDFVLYSAGFANRFGFPSPAVQARVQALGAEQLNTAGAGAVGFRLGGDGVEGPFLHRLRERRLWTYPGSGG